MKLPLLSTFNRLLATFAVAQAAFNLGSLPAGAAGPVITNVTGNVGAGQVTVNFSTAVNATGLNVNNYFLSDINGSSSIPITGAAYGSGGADTTTVVLTTTPNANYESLQVIGVQDVATSTAMVTTNFTFWGDDPNVTTPATFPAFPGIETTVSSINFDAIKPNVNIFTYAFGLSFSPSFNSLPLWNSPAVDENNTNGVDGSSCEEMIFNTSEFQDSPPAFYGAGMGTESFATNGGAGPGIITSTNLKELKLYFDARISGLGGASNPTNFAGPQPSISLLGPDKGGGNASDYQVQASCTFPTISVSSNWQHYSFLLSDGQGPSTFALWTNSMYPDGTNLWITEYNSFSTIKPGFFFGFWTPLDEFGYNTNSTLYVDNYRLVHVDYSANPPITFNRSGGNLNMTWNQLDKLQSAPTINGPWTDVFGVAGGQYSVPINGPSLYFRTRAPLP